MASPLITAPKITLWQALYAASHPWALEVITKCASPQLIDSGIWQMLAYHMTGTASYLTDARAKFFAFFPSEPTDRNMTREYSWHIGHMYMELEDHFTPEELSTAQDYLNQWGEDLLGIHGSTHATYSTDSDEVCGHRRGIEYIDAALGGDTYRTMTALNGIDYDAMVAEEATYYTGPALGGEWIESGEEYNYGTMMLILTGPPTGGSYAELLAWLPTHALRIQRHLTPDYAEAVKWGDVEHPHDYLSYRIYPLMCMLIGYGYDEDDTLLNFLGNFVAANAPSLTGQYWLFAAMLSGFDPRTIPASPEPDDLDGTSYASGVGHVIRKAGNHQFEFFGSHPTGVHHQPNAMDIRWAVTVDGVSEYVLDAIRGYQTSHPCFNTSLMYGLPYMETTRGITSVAGISGGCRVTFYTEGVRYYSPPFFEPPAAFGTMTRVVDFMDAGSILSTTTFIGTPPTSTERYLYYGDQWAVENSTHPVVELYHFPHAESITSITGGYSIESPNGNVIEITSTGEKSVHSIAGGTEEFGSYFREVGGHRFAGTMQEGERGGSFVKFGAASVITTTLSMAGESPPAGFTSSRPFRRVLRRM